MCSGSDICFAEQKTNIRKPLCPSGGVTGGLKGAEPTQKLFEHATEN